MTESGEPPDSASSGCRAASSPKTAGASLARKGIEVGIAEVDMAMQAAFGEVFG